MKEAGDEPNDKFYELFAIIVHAGLGLKYGHYISIIKYGPVWLQYDDNNISVIRMLVVKNILQLAGDSVFRDIYGTTQKTERHNGCAYKLFYKENTV